MTGAIAMSQEAAERATREVLEQLAPIVNMKSHIIGRCVPRMILLDDGRIEATYPDHIVDVCKQLDTYCQVIIAAALRERGKE